MARSGSRIASSCTGAFLVADVSLLHGRTATTPWKLADEHIAADALRTAEPVFRFGVSERTLSRRFAAATRRGPRQTYLQHARIRHATRLLESASEPIDEIRRRVGYNDPAAFRRADREAIGPSPSGYRDAYGLRNGPDNSTQRWPTRDQGC